MFLRQLHFDICCSANAHSRSGSRSPTFANSIISLATAIVAGSLRSTSPSFAQCGFECGGHRCDVFWPKRVIAVEKWSNRHGEAPEQHSEKEAGRFVSQPGSLDQIKGNAGEINVWPSILRRREVMREKGKQVF
jgi:hypothetical protein